MKPNKPEVLRVLGYADVNPTDKANEDFNPAYFYARLAETPI